MQFLPSFNQLIAKLRHSLTWPECGGLHPLPVNHQRQSMSMRWGRGPNQNTIMTIISPASLARMSEQHKGLDKPRRYVFALSHPPAISQSNIMNIVGG